jgi:diacylglycerol kinase family enzyme
VHTQRIERLQGARRDVIVTPQHISEQLPAAAVFVNEGAGSARAARARRAVELIRALLDADLFVTATRSPAELEGWLRERADDYRTVVIAGGDGSLGVAYNVFTGRDTTLGYIPAGFGNATAHLLRLPSDPERLASLIADGDARAVDLVSIDGHLALFAGAGWDALVAHRYAQAGARGLPGWTRAVVGSLPDLVRRHSVRVDADGQTVFEGPMELLVASTTPFYGRGLMVNPGARPDAGRLTIRIYPGPARMLALEAVRWVARRPPSAPAVHAASATVSAIDGRSIPLQSDGDLLGAKPLWHLEIRPAAVRLIGRWV